MKKFIYILLFFCIFLLGCNNTNNKNKEVEVLYYKTTESEPLKYTITDGLFVLTNEMMTRSGYTFTGAFNSYNGGSMFYNSQGEQLLEIKKNVILYAQWDPIEVKFLLDAMEGSLSEGDSTKLYLYDSEITNLPIPTLEGYDFVGWFNSNDLQCTDSFGNALEQFKILNYQNYSINEEKEINLYAKYKVKICTITFDFQDGSYYYEKLEYPYNTMVDKNQFPALVDDGNKRMLGWSTHPVEMIEMNWEIKDNITLYAVWEYYKNILLYDDSELVDEIEVIMNKDQIELPVLERDGYIFDGWYSDVNFNGPVITKISYGSNFDCLYAKWSLIRYKVSYYGYDEKLIQTNTYLYNDSFELIDCPNFLDQNMMFDCWSVQNGKFIGKELNCGANVSNLSITNDEEIILKAKYVKFYQLTVKESNKGGTFYINEGRIVDTEKEEIIEVSNKSYRNGAKINLISGEKYYCSASYVGDSATSYSFSNDINKVFDSLQMRYYFIMVESDATVTVSSEESCIASGTLITLADGSSKKVEELTLDDSLLVFNHYTGNYQEASIIFIENDGYKIYDVISLYFSNGQVTKIIDEHGFFDLTINKYVYINEDNYSDYIGHQFAMINNNGLNDNCVLMLEDAKLDQEYIGCFSLVTTYHLNYFVDGLFSMPGGIDGIFNIFEYGDDLIYDEKQMIEDINLYGLFTYEDFKEYLPYELYCAFPAEYFKVAIGKEMISFEEIIAMIEIYLVKNGLM